MSPQSHQQSESHRREAGALGPATGAASLGCTVKYTIIGAVMLRRRTHKDMCEPKNSAYSDPDVS